MSLLVATNKDSVRGTEKHTVQGTDEPTDFWHRLAIVSGTIEHTVRGTDEPMVVVPMNHCSGYSQTHSCGTLMRPAFNGSTRHIC